VIDYQGVAAQRTRCLQILRPYGSREKARAFNFYTVIENADMDIAVDMVIAVNNRIGNGLFNNTGRIKMNRFEAGGSQFQTTDNLIDDIIIRILNLADKRA